MPNSYCRYDCYQVTLQVNITEEDSCLFSRYGPSIFNINKVGSTFDCSSCKGSRERRHHERHTTELPSTTNNGSSDSDSDHDHHSDSEYHNGHVTVKAKMPQAVILDITVDRCDCTKATFILFVRLPCKSIDADDFNVDCLNDLSSGINSVVDTLNAAINTYNTQTPIPSPLAPTITNKADLLTDLSNVINDVSGDVFICPLADIASLNTEIHTMKATVKDLIQGEFSDNITHDSKQLLELLNDLSHKLKFEQKFKSEKFIITSGASGYERALITFLVNPLSKNVVSTGVFDKCYAYEITRVAPRVFEPATPPIYEVRDLAKCLDGRKIRIDTSDCIKCCPITQPVLAPNNLHITFPLTKELKCLLPDFNLPGTYINAVEGSLPTLVRIVAACPQKYSFPAKMTFDKIECTVCLEINEYIAKRSYDPYNCEFKLGDCNFFQFLSCARKFDVVGIQKCTEKIFFTFQVAEVPYRSFCVDACGCKVKTIIDRSFDADDVAASFKVISEGAYTYDFSYSKCKEEHSP